jgi:hypothetical protein
VGFGVPAHEFRRGDSLLRVKAGGDEADDRGAGVAPSITIRIAVKSSSPGPSCQEEKRSFAVTSSGRTWTPLASIGSVLAKFPLRSCTSRERLPAGPLPRAPPKSAYQNRPNGPAEPSPGLRPKADALGQESHQDRRPERPRELSIPHVALVKLDLISFQKRTELILKRLHSVMLAGLGHDR